MKIINTAKNGQPVMVLKSFDELNDDELAMLGSDASLKNDYKNVRLQYNKKGELLHVALGDLKDDVETKEAEYSVLDAMTVLYGKKGAKEVTAAKKRCEKEYGTKVATAQINAAKRVLG